jgi:ankyrin repeat protein
MKLLFFLLVLSLKSLQAEVKTAGEMFTQALRDDDLKTIETLLSSGFNPNLPAHGYTPLHHAMQFGRTDAVELLLAGHADPNALVMSGMDVSQYGGNATPLQLAVLLGNVRLASILIESGAHVDAKGTTGRTALHYAVRDGHLEMIQRLIEKGADLNARDSKEANSLDDAAWRGSLDIVAILLAHGARLNESDTKTGATPINEAAFRGHSAVVQYLLQFHPDLGIR